MTGYTRHDGQDQGRRTVIITAILLVLVFAARWVWGQDSVQRVVNPREYWTQEVKKLERELSLAEHSVRAALYDLQEYSRTADLRMTRHLDQLLLAGIPADRAAQLASDYLQLEFQRLTEQLEASQYVLERTRQQLLSAREELSRYESASQHVR